MHVDFIRKAESLKDVLRSAYTSKGKQESTAEHSWRLCLLAMVFGDRLQELDLEKVLQLCVIHDLGEALNGDIPAIDQPVTPEKSEQERCDLIELLRPLPPLLRSKFLSLWEEYDTASSPEARAVKALDKIETIIQHNQGTNPPDFDYAFNLGYGKEQTAYGSLFTKIRELIDNDTRKRMGNAK